MSKVTIISSDCHADPARIDAYGDYLEKQYLDDYRDYIKELARSLGDSGKGTGQSRTDYFSKEHQEKVSEAAAELDVDIDAEGGGARSAIGSNLSLTADPEVRLKELEADGVVAEVIFVNAAWPFAPTGLQAFRSPPRSSESNRQRELQTAGKRSYHRWLGELCMAHPGRRVGIGVLYPVDDVAETVEDLEFMKEEGLGGVMCPPPSGSVPPLWDRYYDPVWAACADLQLPVHFHTGWGEKIDPRIVYLNPNSPDFDPGMTAIDDIERMWLPRRPLWILTLSGVLDRHPILNLVFTELNSDWVGTYLRQMDTVYSDYIRSARKLTEALSLPPSEYWARQCFVGASSISRAEVEIRSEAGPDTIMFGTDYPHNEGTWPTTVKWLKRVLQGVPESDVRKMLGESAIRCYNLDPKQLAEAADRCGPTFEELASGGADLSEGDKKWIDDRGAARPVAFI